MRNRRPLRSSCATRQTGSGRSPATMVNSVSTSTTSRKASSISPLVILQVVQLTGGGGDSLQLGNGFDGVFVRRRCRPVGATASTSVGMSYLPAQPLDHRMVDA